MWPQPLDVYQSDLVSYGWQNDADNAYTNDASATRYFYKDDFTLSLNVSKLDEQVKVTVINHGNIHLASLPKWLMPVRSMHFLTR